MRCTGRASAFARSASADRRSLGGGWLGLPRAGNDELDAADAEPVAFLQRRARDARAVDERAVGALEVHDLERGRPGEQLAVEPRHEARLDGEFRASRAADRLDVPRKNAEREGRLGAIG